MAWQAGFLTRKKYHEEIFKKDLQFNYQSDILLLVLVERQRRQRSK